MSILKDVGASNWKYDISTETFTITYDDEQTNLERILTSLQKGGYPARSKTFFTQ